MQLKIKKTNSPVKKWMKYQTRHFAKEDIQMVNKYHLTLVRIAIIKKSLQMINAGEDMEKKGTLLCCWWECTLVQAPWRTVWRVLKKLKIELPYDSEIPLLVIYLEKNH